MKTIDHLQKALQSTDNPEVKDLIKQTISMVERENTEQFWQFCKTGVYSLYHNGLTFEATSHINYWTGVIFDKDPNGSSIEVLSIRWLRTLADIEAVCLAYAGRVAEK
jgi:hypothetical protein